MCEILVRVTDKINDDFYLNCQCTKRGDVIVVCPDGWNWGSDELKLSFYRIIKLPNVTMNQANAYVSPELPTDPNNPSKTLQKRGWKLDLSNVAIPQPVRNYITDNTRAQPFITFAASAQTMAGLIVQKPPVQDPNIIGNGAANVIG